MLEIPKELTQIADTDTAHYRTYRQSVGERDASIKEQQGVIKDIAVATRLERSAKKNGLSDRAEEWVTDRNEAAAKLGALIVDQPELDEAVEANAIASAEHYANNKDALHDYALRTAPQPVQADQQIPAYVEHPSER